LLNPKEPFNAKERTERKEVNAEMLP